MAKKEKKPKEPKPKKEKKVKEPKAKKEKPPKEPKAKKEKAPKAPKPPKVKKPRRPGNPMNVYTTLMFAAFALLTAALVVLVVTTSMNLTGMSPIKVP